MLPKTIRIFLTVFLGLALFLFFTLAYYNQPTGDDFWCLWMLKQKGFYKTQIFFYTSYTGRVASIALMSALAGNFPFPGLFKVLPVVQIILTFLAAHRLVKAVFKNALSKSSSYGMAAAATVVYYIGLPGIYEGLYWASAAVVYQYAVLALLVLAANAFHFYIDKQPQINWLNGLLAFLLCSTNELSALVFFLLISLPVMFFIRKKKKPDLFFTSLLSGAIIALLLHLLSPGNYAKHSATQGNNWTLVYGSTISLMQTGYQVFRCCMAAPLFWMMVAGLIFICRRQRQYLLQRLSVIFRVPLVWIGGVVVLATVLPGLAAVHLLDVIPPLRVVNIAYGYFLFGAFFMTLYASLKYDFSGIHRRFIIRPAAVSILILAALGSSIFLPNNLRYGLHDLLKGRAALFDRQTEERYALIRHSPADTVVVPNYPDAPFTLCPYEISTQSFQGKHMGYYFGKAMVRTPAPAPFIHPD